MTQGKVSKEEAQHCYEAVGEVMKAFPKNKAIDFIGHFNDVMLFLDKARKELPSEKVETPSSLSQDEIVEHVESNPAEHIQLKIEGKNATKKEVLDYIEKDIAENNSQEFVVDVDLKEGNKEPIENRINELKNKGLSEDASIIIALGERTPDSPRGIFDCEDLEIEIEKIEGDERMSYPFANILTNAPLALIQLEMETKLRGLRKELEERQRRAKEVVEILDKSEADELISQIINQELKSRLGLK